jgi:uncharacterized heparinase superfamily protein
VFAGAHDGYARLGVIHHRHIVATDDAWIVVDELRGSGRHRFDSRLHFHPDLRLESSGQDWHVASARGAWLVRLLGPVSAEAGSGWYAPDWNAQVRAPVLGLHGDAAMPVTFGFVLTRAGVEAQLTAVANDRGVALEGRLAGRPFRFLSDRCTSSS